MAQRKVFAILGILAGLLMVEACGRILPAQQSCNFVQNQSLQRVSWTTNLPVTMYLDASIPAEYVDSVNGAIKTWNDLGQKINNQDFFVLKSGNPGSSTPTQDGYSKIYLMNTWEPNLANEQARTTIYWVGSRIYEADMRLDGANFQFYTNAAQPDPTKVHLQSLVLHELGHVLGLAHNTEIDSVMQASLANGTERDTPGNTDINDLKCQY